MSATEQCESGVQVIEIDDDDEDDDCVMLSSFIAAKHSKRPLRNNADLLMYWFDESLSLPQLNYQRHELEEYENAQKKYKSLQLESRVYNENIIQRFPKEQKELHSAKCEKNVSAQHEHVTSSSNIIPQLDISSERKMSRVMLERQRLGKELEKACKASANTTNLLALPSNPKKTEQPGTISMTKGLDAEDKDEGQCGSSSTMIVNGYGGKDDTNISNKEKTVDLARVSLNIECSSDISLNSPLISERCYDVPLDQVYYGKIEGRPDYGEVKSNAYRFKCWQCQKIVFSNMSLMLHMHAHMDSEKHINVDLSDLTICKHCYQQFSTPFLMQTHVEKVHQQKLCIFVCRICEKDHINKSSLITHMKIFHVECEMPYRCTMCGFRSSVYDDVIDHFKKRHEGSSSVLCFYCFKVFEIHRPKNCGIGLTKSYLAHLQKHLSKASKKCPKCRLNFLNATDLKNHRDNDHNSIERASVKTLRNQSNQDKVLMQMPQKKVHSLNVNFSSHHWDFSSLKFLIPFMHRCQECKKPMKEANHFLKHRRCSMCRFATSCNFHFSAHMLTFHSSKKILPKKKASDLQFFCRCNCGFLSQVANDVANHVVQCHHGFVKLLLPSRPSRSQEPGYAGSSFFTNLGLVRRDQSEKYNDKIDDKSSS